MMRFAVVANCQARPVADLIRLMSADPSNGSIIITHLASNATQKADYALLGEADFIFAQFVTDEYHAPHLATSRLKELFGDRVISWPNIFFRGQCPDLTYAATLRIARILGPLREYHLCDLLRYWREGRGRNDCLAMLRAPDARYTNLVDSIAGDSLQQLRGREELLDVGVSDVIDAEWRYRRLFFTFNHPGLHLLEALAKRLLDRIGVAALPIPALAVEPLGRVQPPVLQREVARAAWIVPNEVSLGAECIVNQGAATNGGNRSFDLEQLVDKFYIAYDAQLDRSESIKFSPATSTVLGAA